MAVPLTSRRNRAHYGDRVFQFGMPVLNVKAGKRTDYVTGVEVVEDLYEKPVQRIIFGDGSSISRAGV